MSLLFSTGLVRVHMVHIVRDVLMMLEGRTVGDALILDTIRNPIAIPTAALAPRVNEILHRIREQDFTQSMSLQNLEPKHFYLF